MLTRQLQEIADRSVLCWLATVDQTGQPSVSPKEIFAVADEHHLVVANIASPNSVRNVRTSPLVCVSFIDVFAQKGFKVLGEARNVSPADLDYDRWSGLLSIKAGPRFHIHSVIVIRASAVEPILAPSYRLYPDTTTEAGQIEAAMKTYGVKPDRSGA